MKEYRTPEEEITALRRQYYARKRDAQVTAQRASSFDTGTEDAVASILGDEEDSSVRVGKTQDLRAAIARENAHMLQQAALRLVRAELKYRIDLEEAISILNEMANRNDTKAILVFARLFEKGGFYTKDYGKARECLEWAEELGDPEADFQLGRYYRLGIGVERDDSMAVSYFERASRGGYQKADYQLAALYFAQGTPQAAVRRLELAALHHVPGARYDYAMCLLYGDGVKADPAKAVQILSESAENGDPEAAEKLAFMYEQGFRVDPDPAKAVAYRTMLSRMTAESASQQKKRSVRSSAAAGSAPMKSRLERGGNRNAAVRTAAAGTDQVSERRETAPASTKARPVKDGEKKTAVADKTSASGKARRTLRGLFGRRTR